MSKYLFLLLLTASLTACSVFPAPEKAPQQLLLSSLAPSQETSRHSDMQIRLVIERPLASTPLRQREIWYRDAGLQLTPFSRHLWAESLDLQLQSLTAEFLAQQPWAEAVSLDRPGFRAEYRLHLNLQHWYLDTAQEELLISLQANLLDSDGNSLLQRQWNEKQPVARLSPQGVAQASQTWLENWIVELNQSLKDHWQK
ncbi:ABC-type transport auxiliary lipoprotein family protein [Marinospirillum sp.]|uniref:ABC-type transport auxiliary lipoprotein family protein n=1 Tax=Marinospirillum sp. TaxID=2183934 RepID=UPI00384D25EC